VSERPIKTPYRVINPNPDLFYGWSYYIVPSSELVSGQVLYDRLFTKDQVSKMLSSSLQTLLVDPLINHSSEFYSSFKTLKPMVDAAEQCKQQEEKNPGPTNRQRYQRALKNLVKTATKLWEMKDGSNDEADTFRKRLPLYVKDFFHQAFSLIGAFFEVKGLGNACHDDEWSKLLSSLMVQVNSTKAPFGVHHSQLRIGSLIFSRQIPEPGKQDHIKIISGHKFRVGSLDFPLRLLKFDPGWMDELLKILLAPGDEILELQEAFIENVVPKLTENFYEFYPEEKLLNFCNIIFEWNRTSYCNWSSNCHHFVGQAMKALEIGIPTDAMSWLEEHFRAIGTNPLAKPSSLGSTPKLYLAKVQSMLNENDPILRQNLGYAIAAGRYFYTMLSGPGIFKFQYTYEDMIEDGIPSYSQLHDVRSKLLETVTLLSEILIVH
jgi:hypothetical protein